jgi:NAD-dependent SIR2 family protein deacetylase
MWNLKDIKEVHTLSKRGRGYHVNTEMIDWLIKEIENKEKEIVQLKGDVAVYKYQVDSAKGYLG